MDAGAGDVAAPYSTRLAAAGRHLPATHLTTAELMSTTRHHTHIDLERLTGIHERRVSVGDEDSFSLVTSAALDCLDRTGQRAESLDVVICCRSTKFRGGLNAPTAESGRIGLAGFTTVADYSRLCLAYPKGHEPGMPSADS